VNNDNNIFLTYTDQFILFCKALTPFKMSQIPIENDDDNRSVAASDFVQFDQPDEMADQEVQQDQQEQQQFGLHQNPLDWTMNTGSAVTQNYANELKDQKMATLEVFLGRE
jgi:hypothetical protein